MEKLATEIATKDSVIAEIQGVKDSLEVENKVSKKALEELIAYERGLDNRVDEAQKHIERIVNDTTVNVDEYLRYLRKRNETSN